MKKELILIFLVLLLVKLASATINISINSPTVNTSFTTTISLINITTGENNTNCTYQIINETGIQIGPTQLGDNDTTEHTAIDTNITSIGDGNYNISIFCLNSANIADNNTEAVIFRKDTVKPNTTAYQIIGGSTLWPFDTWTGYGDIIAYFTCNDTGGSGCGTTLYCSDLDNTCEPNISFTRGPPDMPFYWGDMVIIGTQGVSYIRYRSNDSAGNEEDVKNVTVKIDSTVPWTNATAVNDTGGNYELGSWVNSSYVNVTLACNDSTPPYGSTCISITYCNDTKNTCVPDTNYTEPIQISSKGKSYIRFYSTDVSIHNEDTQSTEVDIIESDPPTTTADAFFGGTGTPYPFGDWTGYSTVGVYLGCNDASGCNTTLYCNDITNTCIPNETYSGGVSVWTQGTSYFRFKSNDSLGNEESIKNKTIRIDTAGPTTTATAINDTGGSYTLGSWVNSSYVNVTLTCDDGVGCGCNETFYCNDTTNICTPDILYMGEIIKISREGTNYLRYMSNDIIQKEEAVKSKSINIYRTNSVVELSPPRLSIISPINTTYLTSIIDFNISANKNLSSCEYSVDNWITNTTMDSLNSTYFYKVVNVSDGNYITRFWCNDTEGRINDTEYVQFIYDTTLPWISFGTGTEDSGMNLSSNSIYVKVTVNETNEANITFTLYNATAIFNETTMLAGTRTFNWTNVVDGIYYYNVSVIDTSGHSNKTETRTITLDTTAPAITVFYPVNNSVYYINQSILIDYTAYDLLGVYKWWTNWDSDAIIPLTELSSINFSSEGTYNITIFANDSLNHISNKTIFFNVSVLPDNKILANSSENQIIIDDSNENISEITIPSNNSLENITVSNETNQSFQLDLSQLEVEGVVVLDNSLSIVRTFNDGKNYSIYMPTNINISGNSSWNRKLEIPLVVEGDELSAPTLVGYETSVEIVISVGSEVELNFSSPVKIIIGNQAGKRAGWTRSGTTLNDISTYCNNYELTPTNINSTVRECYTNDSSNTDLIIWTYHFTNFAAYSATPEETNNDDRDRRDGGGGGGGSSVVSSWVKDIKVNDSEFNVGQVLKQMKTKYRLIFNMNGMGHSIGILNITNTTMSIIVNSTPQYATLAIGESKKFDLDTDGYYDIVVGLISIIDGDATLSLQKINEAVIQTSTPSENTNTNTQNTPTQPSNNNPQTNTNNKKSSTVIYWVIGAVILVILIIMIAWRKKNSK